METSVFFTRTESSVYFLLSPYKRNSFPSINPAQVGSLIPWAEEQRRDGAVREAKQQLVPLSQRGGGQTETEKWAKWIVKDKAESQILRCRHRGAKNTQVHVGGWGGVSWRLFGGSQEVRKANLRWVSKVVLFEEPPWSDQVIKSTA